MAILPLQSLVKSECLGRRGFRTDPTDPVAFCRLQVTFVDKEGEEHKFEVAPGDNLLDIAQSEELEMEGN